MANIFAQYPVKGGSSGGSTVTSINTLTGAIILAAGTGISITPSGNTLTIANTQTPGANTALSNLTSPTAINQSLLFGTDATDTIGASQASRPSNIFASGLLTLGDTTGMLQIILDPTMPAIELGGAGFPTITIQGAALVLNAQGSQVLMNGDGFDLNTSVSIMSETFDQNLGAQSVLKFGSAYTMGNRFWDCYLMNTLRTGQGLTQGQVIVGNVTGGGGSLNVKQRTTTQFRDLDNSASGVTTANASTTVNVTSSNGVSTNMQVSPGDTATIGGTTTPIVTVPSDTSFTVVSPVGNGTSTAVDINYSMLRVEDVAGNINFLIDPTGLFNIGVVGGTLTHIINGQLNVTGGLIGVTNGSDAAAGIVGEFMTAQQLTPTNAGATTAAATVASVSLTAGDWDVEGLVNWQLNGSVTTFARAGITLSSADVGIEGQSTFTGGPPTSAYSTTCPIPRVRFSFTTTTTVFLTAAAGYSAGTPQFIGTITARRVR